VSQFYLAGKENGKEMVSGSAETTKEKQQHTTYNGSCCDFIECTTIMLFSYAAY